MNVTPYDFVVDDHGTIVLITPMNDYARSWIDDHLYSEESAPRWWGAGVVIDHRCFEDIAEGLIADGCRVVVS